MKLESICFYREVKPYLDRLFPGWKVEEAGGGSSCNERAFVFATTSLFQVSLVRDHDGDEVSLAPIGHSDPEGETISVPYLLWLMREGVSGRKVTEQLDWLEMHGAWLTHWSKGNVYDAYRAKRHEFNKSFLEIREHYWYRGFKARDAVHYPKAVPELRAAIQAFFKGEPKFDLLHRSTPYFDAVLGSPWTVASSGSGDGESIVAGPKMRLRLGQTALTETAQIAPARGAEDRWLNIERIAHLIAREELGRSIETKLAFLLRRIEDFEYMCGGEHFPTVLNLIDAAERANAESLSILLPGSPWSTR